MLTAPFGAHHRHLGSRPGDVEVGADVLGGHDVVRAAVGLARDDGQLRNGRLGVGVEELRAVADDPAPLLRRARKESRNVDEGHERDVECVARPYEACGLDGGVDVENSGERCRAGCRRRRPHGRRAGRSRRRCSPRSAAWTSRNSPPSTTRSMTLLDVVRLVRAIGNDRVERRILTIDRVRGRRERRQCRGCSEAGTRVGSGPLLDRSPRPGR